MSKSNLVKELTKDLNDLMVKIKKYELEDKLAKESLNKDEEFCTCERDYDSDWLSECSHCEYVGEGGYSRDGKEKYVSCKCDCYSSQTMTEIDKMEILKNVEVPWLPKTKFRKQSLDPTTAASSKCSSCECKKYEHKKTIKTAESKINSKKRQLPMPPIKKEFIHYEDPRIKKIFGTLKQRKHLQDNQNESHTNVDRANVERTNVVHVDRLTFLEKINRFAKFSLSLSNIFVSALKKSVSLLIDVFYIQMQTFKLYVTYIEKHGLLMGKRLNHSSIFWINEFFVILSYLNNQTGLYSFIQMLPHKFMQFYYSQMNSCNCNVSDENKMITRFCGCGDINDTECVNMKKISRAIQKKYERKHSSGENYGIKVEKNILSNLISNIKQILYATKSNYDVMLQFQQQIKQSAVLKNVANIFTLTNFNTNYVNFDGIYKYLKLEKMKDLKKGPSKTDLEPPYEYQNESSENEDVVDFNIYELNETHIIVEWSKPDNVDEISGYKIYVDNVEMGTVNSNSRSIALIGPIDDTSKYHTVTLCRM